MSMKTGSADTKCGSLRLTDAEMDRNSLMPQGRCLPGHPTEPPDEREEHPVVGRLPQVPGKASGTEPRVARERKPQTMRRLSKADLS